MFNRSRSLAVAILVHAFGGIPPLPGSPAVPAPLPENPPKRRKKSKGTRVKVHRSGGRYMPHQGERERLRRIGGQPWELYKRADRIFRGLVPMPPRAAPIADFAPVAVRELADA